MEQLDTRYLAEVLAILKDAGATHFRCNEFSVAFEGQPEEEEDEEPISTDVRSFAAPSTTDDEEEDLASMHHRAFGGPMPLLNPKKTV